MVQMLDWDPGDGSGGGGRTGGGGLSGTGGTVDAINIEFGRLMLAVSEGDIKGLVTDDGTKNALKSIYLNDTAICNADGTFNFNGVSVALVAGTNTQAMIPGFPDVESEVGVNVKVTYSTPSTHSISTSGLSAVRIRIAIPQLKKINSADGKESGTSVQIKIERQRTGYNSDAYEEVALDQNGVIRGKFGSKYTKSFRIELPNVGTGAWTIRVSRLTVDAPDAYTLNETWWESYTELTDTKLRYPNTAALAIMVDAKQFQSMPQVSADMDLRIIQVPANYTPPVQDPATGVWTGATYATSGAGTTGGIWDGTFKQAFTRNPVWQFYDMAIHTRYGGGTYLTASGMSIYDLYAISQVCDVLVSDGKGGTEPRYFCDVHIQGQEEAIKVLDHFASTFRGMSYWANGKITAIQDVDEDPITIFTAANVKDGKFTYNGSGRRARHTAAIISYSDPQAGYRQATTYVESVEGIARYGLNIIKIAGFGVTSEGLAKRLGYWNILSDLRSPETVTFTTGAAGAVTRPGNVIQVMDPHRAGLTRFGGRVNPTGTTTTHIVLDAAITLPSGTNYLLCQLPDGSLETKTITTAAGSAAAVDVSAAFSAIPADVWIVQAGAVATKYRVIAAKEAGSLAYDILALYHDVNKYADIETGLTVGDGGATTATAFPPVVSLSANETLRIQNDKLIVVLTASWLPPTIAAGGANPIAYIVDASRDEGPWVPMVVSATSAELTNVELGPYRVRVIAAYRDNNSSAKLASYTVLGKSLPPADVTNFVADIQGDVFQATWDPVPDLDLDYYVIRVPGATGTDAVKWSTGVAVEGCDELSVTSVAIVRPANGAYDYWIKAVDTSGNESANPTKLSFTVNPLDDYVTPTEKRSWKAEFDTIVADQTLLDAKAIVAGVSSSAYDTAISALKTYLATLVGAQGWTGSPTFNWASYSAQYYLGNASPATTGSIFFSKFCDVWTTRDVLKDAINGSLFNDDILTSIEKIIIKQERDKYYNGFNTATTGLKANAIAAGVSWTACDTAITAQDTHLATYTHADGWNNTTKDWKTLNSLVLAAGGGALLRTKMKAVVDAWDALRGAIDNALVSAAAGALAGAPALLNALVALPDGSYPHDKLVWLRVNWTDTAGIVGPAGDVWPTGMYRADLTTGVWTWKSAATMANQIIGQLIAGQISAGAIGANALAAILIMTTVLRSTVYTAGATGVVPVGFYLSGAVFNSTLYDGTVISTNMEIGSAVNLGGESVGGVLNRVKGSSVTLSGSGNWTVPEMVTWATVRMAGAGGSGAGGNSGGTIGGGGGGAASVVERIIALTPGTTVAYSVAAASTGGATNTNGNDGANTTFGSHTAYGGKKGLTSGVGGSGADAISADGSITVLGAPNNDVSVLGSIGTQQERFTVGWLIPGAGGGDGGLTGLGNISYEGGNCDLFSGGAAGLTNNSGGGGGGGGASDLGTGGAGGNGSGPNAGSAGTGKGSGGGGGGYKSLGGTVAAGGNGAAGTIFISW